MIIDKVEANKTYLVSYVDDKKVSDIFEMSIVNETKECYLITEKHTFSNYFENPNPFYIMKSNIFEKYNFIEEI